MTILLGFVCVLTALMVGLHLWHVGMILQIHFARWFKNEEGPVKPALIEFMEFVKAFEQYEPHMDALIARLADPFVKDSARVMTEGTLRGADLLRTLRQRAQTEYLEDMKQVRWLSRLDEAVPAIGWLLGLCLTFWLIANPSAMSYQTVLATVAGFGGFSLYAVLFSYVILLPADRAFRERVIKNRLKNLVIVEALGHVIRGKKTYEVFDYINAVMPSEDHVEWHDVFSTEKKAA